MMRTVVFSHTPSSSSLQDMTDKRCKQLDELAAKKETELMAV